MTDRAQSDRDKHIIDMEVKEQIIPHEEIMKHYVDIKQVGQILDNASERTVYRIFTKMKAKHAFMPDSMTVNDNGVMRKLYKKEDVLRVAELVHRRPTVTVYKTEFVKDTNGTTDIMTSKESDSMPDVGRVTDRDSVNTQPIKINEVKESIEKVANALDVIKTEYAAIGEFRQSFKDFSGNIKDLNDNVKNLNMMMQNIVTKVVDQGIDLKEKYLEDKQKRFELELKQAEAMARLAEKATQKPPIGKVVLIFTAALAIIIIVAFYVIKDSNQKFAMQIGVLEKNQKLQNENLNNALAKNSEELKKLSQLPLQIQTIIARPEAPAPETMLQEKPIKNKE